ncbi:hypothetical protein Ssi03_76030 [Sphaerisporangium siamense]|uniref:Uncharacterized protein n=1 Tax=Sphaerisporangium siamense TaxID=795645 RepID=A0A7W7D2U1_9ACTN|nr:hypothetical protein [Sphaerisporangium siamense]MBB4699284.1 hypothetical protein [Sphaerisporangium siamense]GII89613.1 hypothetical protein Ssi03_76030 [Sphaerisporangium siamense]
MAGTPNYPRDFTDEVRDLRASRTAAQTAGQSRVAYTSASQGLILPNMASDPPAPASGVVLYAKAGHFFVREADGSIHQLTS